MVAGKPEQTSDHRPQGSGESEVILARDVASDAIPRCVHLESRFGGCIPMACEPAGRTFIQIEALHA